jgi:transglutaminase-like putative cysteine protease
LCVAQSEDATIIKYEVNDAFIGNLLHTIRIDNPTLYTVEDLKLFVPLIRNETARHYVALSNISSSIGQPEMIKDDSENIYAYWDSITLNARQSLRVDISYYLLSFDIHYLVNSSLPENYDKNSGLYRRYTQSEPLIESDDPEMISKAQSVTNSSNTTFGKVSRIYNFVVSYMRYAVQDEERGALWALENKTGDCSEYSYLFVALCRAIGIPARIQAGFAFYSTTETTEDGHMWAEYYLENYGWVPVDATWRQFNALDFKHFSSVQSTPEFTPYSNYFYNDTSGAELVDNQTLTLNPCPASVFGNNSFAENAVKAIDKINQAKSSLFIGETVGISWIFPSETEQVENALLESKLMLQNMLELFDQTGIDAGIMKAEESSRTVWSAILKALAIYVTAAAVILLIAAIFLTRH